MTKKSLSKPSSSFAFPCMLGTALRLWEVLRGALLKSHLLAFTIINPTVTPGIAAQWLAFPHVRTCLNCAFSFLTSVGQCRKTTLYPGCIPVEGNISQHHTKKEQHGVWIYHHWWRWAWWVSAGEKRDSRWACSSGRKNGNR